MQRKSPTPEPTLKLCPDQEHAGPDKEGKGLNQKRAIGPSPHMPGGARSVCIVLDADEGFIQSARTYSWVLRNYQCILSCDIVYNSLLNI